MGAENSAPHGGGRDARRTFEEHWIELDSRKQELRLSPSNAEPWEFGLTTGRKAIRVVSAAEAKANGWGERLHVAEVEGSSYVIPTSTQVVPRRARGRNVLLPLLPCCCVCAQPGRLKKSKPPKDGSRLIVRLDLRLPANQRILLEFVQDHMRYE